MNALQVVTTLTQLTSTLLTLSLRIQEASQLIQRSRIEGWADDDPRWAQAWADADQDLQEALQKLRG
jgi:hypothetical protein